MFDNKASWSVNFIFNIIINKKCKLIIYFLGTIQAIQLFFNSISMIEFSRSTQSLWRFQLDEIFRKSFIFFIIIDNTIYIRNSNLNFIYDSVFLSHWSFFFISSAYDLYLAYFFYRFFLANSAYFWFTYTTYITVKVKSNFLII